MKIMKVITRSGKEEELSLDKILLRIKNLALNNNLDVDYDALTLNVVKSIYDGICTSELDEETARIAVNDIQNPDNLRLASLLIIDSHHKNTTGSFCEKITKLYDFGIISDKVFKVVNENKKFFENLIDYSKDYYFDYFGFKTLEKAYLLKINDVVIERPQDLLLREALGIHIDDLDSIKESYIALSDHYFTHATPTMFHSGTKKNQFSSCYLLTPSSDSVEGLYKTVSDCAKISQYAGGVGIHASDVRCAGSKVKGTNGKAGGIPPYLKVLNETAKHINQCFEENTLIITDKGLKKISNVSVDDNVLTETGEFHPVELISSQNIDKEIYEVYLEYYPKPVKVTKEHIVYCLKNLSRLSQTIVKSRLQSDALELQFLPLSQVSVFDYLVYSIPEESDGLEMSSFLAKFLGICMSNGVSFTNEQGYTTVFIPSKNRQIYDFIIENIILENFDFEISNDGVVIPISQFGLDYSFFFSRMRKKIDSSIFQMNNNQIKLFLEGFVLGTYSKQDYVEEYYKISTYNSELLESFRYLCLKLGYLCEGFETGKINHISIPNTDLIEPFQDKQGLYFYHNNKYYCKIRQMRRFTFRGTVYDLTISGDTNNVMNSTYTCLNLGVVHNSGKRPGSFAVFLEPHHADIFSFLDMKKNDGKEEFRARDLFYSVWVSDLFMNCVKEDKDWYLMCPSECPGLTDAYGDKYSELYYSYVSQKKYIKKVKARDIWKKILELQIETGTPYIGYKDAANHKSNQKNIGTIKGSNLCHEIMEVTDKNSISVCNLASICLPKFIENGVFRFDKLQKIVEICVKNLNKVIDGCFYPLPETKNTNLRDRPIGLGVQGLANTYMILNLPFESEEARLLNIQIFESIYYTSLKVSCELAKKDGYYTTYQGSPASQGLLQFDLWKDNNPDIDLNKYLTLGLDWESLKKDISKYGLRNSLLTTCMPTASTAQIFSNSECIEPITSNMFVRRVLAGEFIVLNKYMVEDFKKLNLWNENTKDLLLHFNGSIQSIPGIPEHLKKKYKTVWEISQKELIQQSADRGLFIDQSQSLNLFLESPSFSKLNSMHFFSWEKGLKTGIYYLRTKSPSRSFQITVDSEKIKKLTEEPVSCPYVPGQSPEDCLMCSS